jgi:prepilin-type N-terminal cleavage/methylation domain-containing protein
MRGARAHENPGRSSVGWQDPGETLWASGNRGGAQEAPKEGDQGTMFNQIRNRNEWGDKSVSQKGFTLIELLVVIAILGVLAVVGVLSFGGLTNTAKGATAKTELTQIQAAVDAYNAKHGVYPAAATPFALATLQTDGDLKGGTGPTVTFQCSYDLDASGNVAFDATQTDPNCK